MENIAVITAKGGNQTLENKNIVQIAGLPSIAYSIDAALEAELIGEVYVTSECPEIKKIALKLGAKVIDRPFELSQPLSNHGDVIIHAVREVAKRVTDIGTVTILLGNTVMTCADDIDETIRKTLENEEVDSCMTVWKAQDDHPYRAMIVDEEGYLKPFVEKENVDTNRQSYPVVYFYDQGPWTVRYASLLRSERTREGPGPWWWMGKNCVPIERLWVTGRDTHTPFDIEIAEWWLNRYKLAGRRNPPNAEYYKREKR